MHCQDKMRRKCSKTRAARRLLTNWCHNNFLTHFGFDTLRDLPDFEALEDAGLLSKDKLLGGDIPVGQTSGERDDEVDIVAEGEMP